jgi:hypothetical protein
MCVFSQHLIQYYRGDVIIGGGKLIHAGCGSKNGTQFRAHGSLDMKDNILNASTTTIPEKVWDKFKQPIVEEMLDNYWTQTKFKEHISKTKFNSFYSHSKGKYEVNYNTLFKSLPK